MNSIKLWDGNIPYYNSEFNNEENFNTSTITPYLINDNQKHSCIIVIPGGGYNHRSEKEGKQISEWLNCIGINSFVLNYRVAPYKHPVEITDAKRAIRYIRFYCDKFNIKSDKIGVMGFSSGGHLACNISEHFDEFDFNIYDEIDNINARPDICILCYPVITLIKEFMHSASRKLLVGDDEKLALKLSCEENVNKNTPPMFIWHTFEDGSVDVLNSIEMGKALSKNNIPFELHIFPDGKHGLNFAKDIEGTKQWSYLCKNWLERMMFL